jgi:hypothetical protein
MKLFNIKITIPQNVAFIQCGDDTKAIWTERHKIGDYVNVNTINFMDQTSSFIVMNPVNRKN